MSQFGPYRLVQRLAMGGMGEIYLAKLEREAGFEKELVIKRILPTLSDDPEFIEMFNREACVAARLNHQNIVQIYDYGQHQGAYFIAMEYVHGRDLRTLLEEAAARGVKVPAEVAFGVVSAVAEGLHYAHRRRDVDGTTLGLVHRDVSPQNVLISYEGEIKLTDFGLVQTGDVSGQERDGVLRGKFAYMSPEQTWGDELDLRSDVFSLGIVAYELFVGRPPFEGATLAELMAAIRADPVRVVPASERRPELPRSIDGVFHKALAARREDRYADARELQLALEAVAREQGWTRSPLAMGAFVAALCPPERDLEPALGGATAAARRPIGLRPTEPAGVPESLHRHATVPASEPIVSRPAEAGAEPSPPATTPVVAPVPEPEPPEPSPLSPPPALSATPSVAGRSPEPPSRRWLAGLGLLAIGVLGVSVILATRPADDDDAWTLHIDAVPENTEVYVDGAPRGTAPTSITNVAGGRKVEITLAHEGYKTQTETVDLRTGGGTQRVHAVLEPEVHGHVMLTVDPTHAQVFVADQPVVADDAAAGMFRISGQPGEVQVRVEAEGYQPREQALEIPARSVTHHVIELRARHVKVDVVPDRAGAVGQVTLEARDFQTRCGLPCSVRVPWAKQSRLKVTAELEGVETPWTTTQPLTPGGHVHVVVPVPEAPKAVEPRFRAVLAGRSADGGPHQVRLADAVLTRVGSGVRSATLPDGLTVTLRYEYEPATRKLQLNLGCSPWCQVSLDGRPVGQTSLTGLSVPPGNHSLQLTNRDAVVRLSYSP